jgi:hypothetical protein
MKTEGFDARNGCEGATRNLLVTSTALIQAVKKMSCRLAPVSQGIGGHAQVVLRWQPSTGSRPSYADTPQQRVRYAIVTSRNALRAQLRLLRGRVGFSHARAPNYPRVHLITKGCQ